MGRARRRSGWWSGGIFAVAGDEGYNPACDLSGDGTVDLADLLIMIEDRGK
jgi:hypothetical protein